MAAPNEISKAVSSLMAGDFLGAVVKNVTVYSEYTAPTVYQPPAVRTSNQPGGETTKPKGGSTWGSLFKPTIVIDSPLSPEPYVFAPYGVADPEAYRRKQFALVWGPITVLALVGAAAFFLGRASK